MSKRVSFTTLLNPTAPAEAPAVELGAAPGRAALAEVAANPDNPRDPEDLDLDELIASFQEVGQLQPIVVVSRAVYLAHVPGNAGQIGDAAYVVLGGNRRLEAARALGWTHLDIAVRDHLGDGEESFLDEAVIIENIHRKSLAPVKEAGFLQQMVERYGSQGKVAKRIGKTQAYVSQRLSLLRLAPELREAVDEGALKVKEARKLAALPGAEEQRAALARARQAPETHNRVMGRSGPTPAGSGPVVPAPSPAPSTAPAARPTPAETTEEGPEPLPDLLTVGAVPWGDNQTLRAILVERKPPGSLAGLVVELLGALDTEGRQRVARALAARE